jgi:hypothetical protein
MDGLSVMKGLLQCVEHEAGMGCPTDPPAHDPSCVGIDYKGDVDEAGPGRDVGEVRDPQHVRPRRPELAVHVIQRARCGLVADRRAYRLAPDHPLQAHALHQTLHGAARNIKAFALELPPDLANTVDSEVLLEDPTNFDLQRGVASRAGRQPRGIGPLGDIGPIGRRGDRQYLADRLDPMDPTMIVDEGDHGLNRRSSSAWAK